MEIVFLAPANSIHTVRWVNTLAERGHKINLFFLKNHNDIENRISSSVQKYELPIMGAKGYYLNAFYLKHLIRKLKPDVINVHYASGYGTLMRMAGLNRAVLSVWGSDVYDFPYQNKVCMRILVKNLRYATQIASTSYCMARQTCRVLGEERNIAITPFGVDLKKFCVQNKRKENGKIIIGCVKTLEPKYGIEYLIRAVAILIKDLKKCGKDSIADMIKCYIYGEGSQEQQLLDLIQKENVEGIVCLKGKVSHEKVPEVLGEMDVFCITSTINSESFGVAVVEAQASGLPVVVSDVDGFCEVVENEITGLIVKRKSPEETADALKRLIMNRNLREKMGKAGRIRVERLYDWQKNVSTMEAVYRNMNDEV